MKHGLQQPDGIPVRLLPVGRTAMKIRIEISVKPPAFMNVTKEGQINSEIEKVLQRWLQNVTTHGISDGFVLYDSNGVDCGIVEVAE